MFGPKWKEKLLTLPGNLITEHDKYAGEKSRLDMYRAKLVKLLLFFLKHSGSVNCKVTSSQYRCIEIAEGFKMPFVLSFTADPAMTGRLKSLLSVSEKYFFSDCRRGR